MDLRRRTTRTPTARRLMREVRERARRAAVPPPVLRPLGEALRGRWQLARRHWTRWRAVFLVVAALEVRNAWDDPASRAALAAWIVAGAVSWVVTSLAETDLAARRALHERSGAPAVRGWRLAAGLADLDPELLLQADLLIYLHDSAQLVTRPRRGHRGGTRLTYEIGLRELARRWARSRGIPVRRGDAVARQLVDAGVIGLVTISQAQAWRLTYSNASDALRALEIAAGRPLIDRGIGRDPDWTAADHLPRVAA